MIADLRSCKIHQKSKIVDQYLRRGLGAAKHFKKQSSLESCLSGAKRFCI